MPTPRVLVCDDEEKVRHGIRDMLDDRYEVVLAADGEEALQRLANGAFDLVILDIKLPNVDGLEVLKRLRARPLSPPVIMLTAYQSMEIAQRAGGAGAVDYLTKPVGRDGLLNAVDRALGLPPR